MRSWRMLVVTAAVAGSMALGALCGRPHHNATQPVARRDASNATTALAIENATEEDNTPALVAMASVVAFLVVLLLLLYALWICCRRGKPKSVGGKEPVMPS